MLCRNNDQWPESRIKDIMFPNGQITENALIWLGEMQMAVRRDIPPVQQLPDSDKAPLTYTPEESVVRIYRSLGEKYNWTYRQCLELTDYQVYWYLYMLPEDIARLNELNDMIAKNKETSGKSAGSNDTPLPNIKKFDTPEEYEAWLVTQPKPSGMVKSKSV